MRRAPQVTQRALRAVGLIAITSCIPRVLAVKEDDAGPAPPKARKDSGLPERDEDPFADAGAVDATVDASVADSSKPDGGTVFVASEESLTAAELGVLVNADDPQSVAVAAHYKAARGIPDANVISLHLGGTYASNQTKTVASSTFATWKTQIDQATPPSVQAYAVTWTYPTAVDCMSLTSALAFGFDARYCSQPTPAAPCTETQATPYFDADVRKPWSSLALRPAMVLVGTTAAIANALIDRGVAADGTYPLTRGYLYKTADADRSVRADDFAAVAAAWSDPAGLSFNYVDNSTSGSGALTYATDVLFYFTGLPSVPGIATNTFRPGAVADHLTSFGGQVPTSTQMSAYAWITAGATGSYGTVVEPCNYPEKFPRVSTLVARYFAGETLLEAYWKSVNWPGEGLFLGEPLARPFGTRASVTGTTLTVRTTAMKPGMIYRVQSSSSASGPWTDVGPDVSVTAAAYREIVVEGATQPYYRFARR